MNIGPMLNAYPDSMGGTLDDIAAFLQKPEMKDVFSSCYVLPSLFHTDLDRGFSVIDYSLNKMLASREALDKLEGLGIDLKLDFILNGDTILISEGCTHHRQCDDIGTVKAVPGYHKKW